MNSSEQNSIKYSIDYGETQMDQRNQIRVKKIIELIDPCEKLLDLGCWDGFIMNEIIRSKKVKSAIGLDNSKPAVEMAKKKKLDVRFVESVDEKLPFGDKSFDCIYAGEIVEHIYDVNVFVREIARVLKKNGQLIITTPNLASFGSRVRLAFGRTPWMIENIIDKQMAGHLRYFTFDSLKEILEARGLKVVSSSTNVIQLGKANISSALLTRLFRTQGSTIMLKCIKP